ncbi:succinate dehydrogenase, cytochrome b556 subunit [Thermomonas flagellata]|uniref:succinate dehydrogenase, cytochrome b556 subunit n=1 Tax=Thermomonas flagellata TaxID=2888524 RepID=UPI001F042479|nr:succinate dehydrogenase, cytochrome b556 subunit [Thermomonas flagellata]
MAAPDPRPPARPLSPHLQIYKWQVQMLSSILHRATGMALVVGLLGVVWALVALASGREAWGHFTAGAGSLPGRVLLFAFSWALAYHLINGVRHLVQDAGHGFAVRDFVRSSWISLLGSVVLVVLAWAVVLLRWGIA